MPRFRTKTALDAPRRLARLSRPLLALLVASWGILGANGLAQGRASCALDFGLTFRARCAVEQTLFSAGPFEIAAGAYVEPHRSWVPIPYTVLLWHQQSFWFAIEAGKYLDNVAFWFRIFGGIRW